MRTYKLLLSAAFVVASTPVLAQAVATDTMEVYANVQNTCTIDAPTQIDVSNGDFANGFSQSGTVSLWCTNGFSVNLSAASANGWNLVGDVTNATIPYTLTGLAGTFTGTSSTTPVGEGFDLNFGAQNPQQDQYRDTVTFTVAP